MLVVEKHQDPVQSSCIGALHNPITIHEPLARPTTNNETMGSTFHRNEKIGLGANSGSFTIREQPLGTVKHVRIVGIGAGASGINLVRTLRQSLRNYDLVIYEKNDDVGGTWLENRYPNCRCDVPSHNYQFSWRPNPEWSNFFSPAKEIGEYLARVCDEEGMSDSIRLRHKIVGAWWQETKGTWDLRVRNLQTGEEFHDEADFIIDGSGILNNWKWPGIPDLHTFQGELIHTAHWPTDFEYKDKTVAVIGNGSSGIQVVPAIQPSVKKLYHIIRTPSWIPPPRLYSMKAMGGPAKEILNEIELDEKENFTQAQIEKFKADPDFYKKFVKAVERDLSGFYPILLQNHPIHKFATGAIQQYMTAALGGDERLCKALIPTYPLGSRRLTPSPGYLECLRAPNVEVVTDGIVRAVPEGLQLASGEIIKLDTIICATGFDNSFCPRFPLVGRNGNVQDRMRSETPKGYMSVALPGVPNYLTFLGPNAPIGHGSVFTLTEHIAKYMARLIHKCQTEQIKAACPSDSAVADYSAYTEAFFPRTAMSVTGTRSWFKGGRAEGSVTALHPGSRIHFFHMLERLRAEDWDFVYDSAANGSRGNRFGYLGNGFSTWELDSEVDAAWYLDDELAKL